MCLYRHTSKDIGTFLAEIYGRGLQRSDCLDEKRIEKMLRTIGIFRFKGYLYAYRGELSRHTIDEVMTLYYFDKFLTRYVMEFTSSIETLLKTRSVELCYRWTDNPFFYLMQENHKFDNFYINQPTLENWKARKKRDGEDEEHYTHYGLYYKNRYLFEKNRAAHLSEVLLIEIKEDVNYPPFHYLIESATLGTLISLIKSIKIGRYDLLHGIAREFGINPKLFVHYLDRLNEVRNRAAHSERLFNRGYRSVRAFKRYKELRRDIEPHSFADLYLYFYFLLGRIDRYESFDDFYAKEVDVLFDEYRHDRLIAEDAFGLNRVMKNEDFDKVKRFILKGMGINKKSRP
jgi:abortive infection bacteriophage resistance protein